MADSPNHGVAGRGRPIRRSNVDGAWTTSPCRPEVRGQVGWRARSQAPKVVLVPEEPGSDSRDCINGSRQGSYGTFRCVRRAWIQPPIGGPEADLPQLGRQCRLGRRHPVDALQVQLLAAVRPAASSRGSARDRSGGHLRIGRCGGQRQQPTAATLHVERRLAADQHHVRAGRALQRQPVGPLSPRPRQRGAVRLRRIGGGQHAPPAVRSSRPPRARRAAGPPPRASRTAPRPSPSTK